MARATVPTACVGLGYVSHTQARLRTPSVTNAVISGPHWEESWSFTRGTHLILRTRNGSLIKQIFDPKVLGPRYSFYTRKH